MRLVGVLLITLAAMAQAPRSSEDCTLKRDPEGDPAKAARHAREVASRTAKFPASAARRQSVEASAVERRNFIDSAIFDRLQQEAKPSAAVASDTEILRRLTLDLTGRIPEPDQIREFVADSNPAKRDALIDRLLYSPEFNDRWTRWAAELLGNIVLNPNINRQISGRNEFHWWIQRQMAAGSIKDMVYQAVTATGNNYTFEGAGANYLMGSRATMGPAQDVYDLMFAHTAEKFLGLNSYDCLLCHDGRNRVSVVNLWGGQQVRADAQRLAAYFSRIRLTRDANRESPTYDSYTISDVTTGGYNLNTNSGNRPNRTAIGSTRTLTPEYRDRSTPASNDWRAEFAAKLVDDRLMAINFANRLWKEMFGYGLVEPVNGLDPARLDPANPPPDPWKLQASHPQLLQDLADALIEQDFSLREFLRILVQSSAYQLSTRYDAPWDETQVPMFARRYPRRLLAEEIHDAIVSATGNVQRYTMTGWEAPLERAIQFPDPTEPRSNGAVRSFLDSFFRGDRYAEPPSQTSSALQQLFRMNDRFVTTRMKVASPRLREVAALGSDEERVDQLYLLFLSRWPDAAEKEMALAHFRGITRNQAVEDIAWALSNKAEFVFSY